MDKFLVSVILPIFNAEKTIKNTIDSIFSQDYKKIEVIAVNDCSTDNTLDILKEYQSDVRFILLNNEENLGAAKSRNKAIEHSTGRYVAFIDSDDTWPSNKITKQVYFMQETDSPVTCTGYARYVNGIFEKNIIPPRYISYKKMLSSCHIGFPTAMVDFYKTRERHFRSIRAREDYVFWLDIFREGFHARGLQEVLCNYAFNKRFAHKTELTKKHWWVFRNIEKMNLIQSSFHITKYVLLGIKKTYF